MSNVQCGNGGGGVSFAQQLQTIDHKMKTNNSDLNGNGSGCGGQLSAAADCRQLCWYSTRYCAMHHFPAKWSIHCVRGAILPDPVEGTETDREKEGKGGGAKLGK